jgi:PGF-CTERM protein
MQNTSAELVTSGPHKGEIAVTTTMYLPEPGFLLVYVDGDPKTVPVPEHKTVERTIYISQNAVDEDGMIYVLAMWDKNENRVYESNPDTLFETSADVDAATEDDELDVTVAVEGWTQTTMTRIPSSTRTTQPGSTIAETTSTPLTTEPTSTSIPGFGPIIAIISVTSAVLLGRRSM